jgi:hypothetical protein
MQRFKPGDAIYILPKFAHLYPGSSATVLSARRDPHQALFNTYVVEFADRSSSAVFDFQIIDNLPEYKTLIATVALDSRQHTVATESRGKTSSEQILLQTGRFDLDINIRAGKSRASLMGQILETGTNNLLKQVAVRLIKQGTPISTTTSDAVGAFKFADFPRGSFNVLMVIPQYSVRILGEFTV